MLIKATINKHEGSDIVQVVSEKFKALISLPIGEFSSTQECDSWPPRTMANISETKAAALDAQWLKKFSDKHLVRVYPKGTRVDSSNFNPLPFLQIGTQVNAINFQHFNVNNFVNFGFFLPTLQTGYVKKPSADAKVEKGKLSLTIHGLRNIPRSQRDILDPYVIASLVSPTFSGDIQKHRTKTVMNNGLNPDFDDFHCDFSVLNAQFSVLVLQVFDQDPGIDDPIAFFAAPVSHLKNGLRVAPLYNHSLYTLNRGLAHVLMTIKFETF